MMHEFVTYADGTLVVSSDIRNNIGLRISYNIASVHSILKNLCKTKF